MRKTFVVALVALVVVLAVTSCDFITGLGSENAADGYVTVKVNINEIGSNSRSLSQDIAENGFNFVEVFIKDGSDGATYTRAAGNPALVTMTVKTDVYTATDALILVGRSSGAERILLGAGRLAPSSYNVVSTTTSLTFNVTALKADLSTLGTSFVISTDFTNDYAGFEPTEGSYEDDNGDVQDCFQVPIGQAGIEASLTIDGFDSSATSNTGTDIFVTGKSVTFLSLDGGDDLNSSVSVTSPTINAAIGPNSLEIAFEFDSEGKSAYMITFDVSVKGISATTVPGASTTTNWSIRGGYVTGLAFTGTSTNNGVALVVVNPDEAEIGSIGIGDWD